VSRKGNRQANVKCWTKFKRSGRFAAMERPQGFIEDVRAFAREIDGA
jgi:hypothetical protein